jgi:hypothetical protein
MQRWFRYTMLTVTVLMVLTMSAMWTVPVLADDEAPPPPETQEVVPPPDTGTSPELPLVEPPTEEPAVVTEEVPPTEAAPAEAIPTESPVTEETSTEASTEETSTVEESLSETPVLEEVAVEDLVLQEEAPGEVLAQVPNGTEVVVVNETGQVVPLVSTEAAEILVTGDPIWCPATVLTPVSGGSGCSPAFASMQEVITYLTNNPKNQAGVIWIAKEYDSSVNDPTATGRLHPERRSDGHNCQFRLDPAGGLERPGNRYDQHYGSL